MLRKLLPLALVTASVGTAGCASERIDTSPPDVGVPDSGAEDSGFVDAGAQDASAPDASQVAEIEFPQAIGGALLASSTVYSEVPLVIEASEPVAVLLGANAIPARDDDADGRYVAMLPVGTLANGTYEITATAGVDSASVDLVVTSTGVQFTNFDEVGSANTPRLHRVDDELWVTWTDVRGGARHIAWLQNIDGAGRPLGPRIEIGPSGSDVVTARVAFGSASIGILYQEVATPFANFFRAVDRMGVETIAPIALDPAGVQGAPGGDITFEDTGWHVVYRSNDGPQRIRWLFIDEATGTQTGPMVVAEAGDGMPDGSFPPFMFFNVVAGENTAMVSFMRQRYDAQLDLEIARSQAVLLDDAGAILSQGVFQDSFTFSFHHEARVFEAHGEFVPLWTVTDLNDPDPNPAYNIFMGRAAPGDRQGPSSYTPLRVVDAPQAREDIVLIEHPDRFGILAYTDLRRRAMMPGAKIGLITHPANDVAATTSVDHAEFVLGTSDIHGTALGTNILLTWRDARNGFGIIDPRPEVWFETLWYAPSQ